MLLSASSLVMPIFPAPNAYLKTCMSSMCDMLYTMTTVDLRVLDLPLHTGNCHLTGGPQSFTSNVPGHDDEETIRCAMMNYVSVDVAVVGCQVLMSSTVVRAKNAR
jgi:hypothetical protein